MYNIMSMTSAWREEHGLAKWSVGDQPWREQMLTVTL